MHHNLFGNFRLQSLCSTHRHQFQGSQLHSLPLGVTNNVMKVEVLESGSNILMECRVLTAFTENVYFAAWYGTDPSHRFLPYHYISDSAVTNGDVVTIQLSHILQHNTMYYYNVSLSAVDESVCSKVLHSFRIGMKNTHALFACHNCGSGLEAIIFSNKPYLN